MKENSLLFGIFAGVAVIAVLLLVLVNAVLSGSGYAAYGGAYSGMVGVSGAGMLGGVMQSMMGSSGLYQNASALSGMPPGCERMM